MGHRRLSFVHQDHYRYQQLKPSFNESGRKLPASAPKSAPRDRSRRTKKAGSSWRLSHLRPGWQTIGIANPVYSPKSGASGACSSPEHSTRTGRNCIICAARVPPGAPSTWRPRAGVRADLFGYLSRGLCRRLRAQALRATMVLPGRRARAVIIAINGFSHDAAALCNSR